MPRAIRLAAAITRTSRILRMAGMLFSSVVDTRLSIMEDHMLPFLLAVGRVVGCCGWPTQTDRHAPGVQCLLQAPCRFVQRVFDTGGCLHTRTNFVDEG